MTDKHVDDAKGRIKEAAGALSGDDDLEREGKTDRAVASVKDSADKVADAFKGAVDKAS